MYIERGMSGTDAALLLASFTAAFMVANPLAGFISRNNDRRRLIALFASKSPVRYLGDCSYAADDAVSFHSPDRPWRRRLLYSWAWCCRSTTHGMRTKRTPG